jgi:hypothetical protein
MDGALSRFASGHLTSYVDASAALALDSTILIRPTVEVTGGTGAYRSRVSAQYVNGGVRMGRADAVVAGATELGWWATAGMGEAGTTNQYETRYATLGTSAQWRALTTALSTDLIHAATATYTDVATHTAVQSEIGIQIELTAGLRFGTNVGDRRRWADVAGVFPLLLRSALVVSVGTVPSDAERGAVGARYASVALRLTFGGFRSRASPKLLSAENIAGTVVSEPQTDGSRTLTLTFPNAHTVDIMGDFTSWKSVAMTRASTGMWVGRVVLTPGSHRVNVSVDGGPWRAPPDLPVAPDDFGGSVGVLVIR